ncbi:MAG: BTAD domain-containing putative transcriptional regulator [Anaerolineae bacterium]
MAKIQVNLLGGFDVLRDGAPLEGFRSDKARALLAYLIVENGYPHQRLALANLLWSEHDESAALTSLRVTLHNLRQIFDALLPSADEDAGLIVTRQTVQLIPPAPSLWWADITTFDALVARQQRYTRQGNASCDTCILRLTYIVELYAGDFLANFHVADAPDFDTWRIREQEMRHRQVGEAFYMLIAYYNAQGDYVRAAEAARRLLELEPWLEAGHRHLIRALALTGQRSLALQQYEACRHVLRTEFNAEPDQDTIALYRQVRDGVLGWEGAPDSALANPYCGLRAFNTADAENFFGRTELVKRLLARMHLANGDTAPPLANEDAWMARFLAVVGPSGSGKSSVVRAGLLPTLRRIAQTQGKQWFFATVLPGNDPLGALRSAITAALTIPRNLAALLNDAVVLEQEGDLAGWLARALPPGSTFFLVVDQAEELITQAADAGRAQILEILLSALRAPDSPLRLIVTLRADYYMQPLLYPDWGKLFTQRVEFTLPLAPEELHEAIVGPATRVGLEVDPALIATLIADVGRSPGALPLLQYTLTELFEHREGQSLSLDVYHAIGGLTGALVRRVDALYTELSTSAQALARQIFLRLVIPGTVTADGRTLPDSRQRVARTELAALNLDSSDDLVTILETFSRYRLLTFDHDPVSGTPTVEIAHESLIERWDRLRDWLQASREDLRVRRYLADLVKTWQEAERDPSYLARGQQLAQLEMWAATSNLTLTPAETAYLDAALEARARLRAEEEAQLARETALRQRAQSLYLSTSAQLALHDQRTDLALTLALEANRIPDPPPQAQLILAEAAYAPGTRRVFTGHAGPVTAVALVDRAGDGQSAATALSASVVQTLILWDLASGDVLRRFTGHTGPVLDVVYISRAHQALSASADHSIILWDVETGCIVQRFAGHSAPVHCLAIDRDGRFALSGSADNTVIVWDLATRRLVHRLTGHTGTVTCVAISPDGVTAISGSADRSLMLWNLHTGERLCHLQAHSGYVFDDHYQGHEGAVWDVAFAPDGQTAISVSEDQGIHFWDVPGGTLRRRLEIRKVGYPCLALSRDGRMALLGTLDGLVVLIDLVNARTILELHGHTGRVKSVAFTADERGTPFPDGALSGADDGTLRLWDLRSGSELRCLTYDEPGIAGVAISPDGKLGLTAFWTGGLQVWDYARGLKVQHLVGHTDMPFAGVHFCPKQACGNEQLTAAGKLPTPTEEISSGLLNRDYRVVSGSGRIFSESHDNTVRLWDVASGRELYRFGGRAHHLWDLAVSSNGAFAISGAHDGAAYVYDLAAGVERLLIDVAPQSLRSVAIHPDCRTALIGLGKGISDTPDYSLRLLDVQTGAEVRRFAGHQEAVACIAFSPDGALAISGSLDRELIVWDAVTGRELRRLLGHTGAIVRVRFSRDGCTALSVSQDQSIILWDVVEGVALRRYLGHTGPLTGLALTPGGRTFLSSADDQTIREWRIDATQDALLDWIQANRHVTPLTIEQKQQYNIQSPPLD